MQALTFARARADALDTHRETDMAILGQKTWAKMVDG